MNLSPDEKKNIDEYLSFYESLDTGKRKPTTPDQEKFIKVCLGIEEPDTIHEHAYLKYKQFREWYATLNVIDLAHNVGHLKNHENSCELCGKNGLRWHCELTHIKSKKKMFVGSECIKKFKISGQDILGNNLDCTETIQNINNTISEIQNRISIDQMLDLLTLLKVKEVGNKMKIDEVETCYSETRRFTPKQLCLVIKGFQKHKIPLDSKMLKTGFQMKDKEEMVKMKDQDFQVIAPYIKETHLKKIEKCRRLGVAF